MDWVISGVLGLFVGWGAKLLYLHLRQYKDDDTYHKSHDHYRDGDNT